MWNPSVSAISQPAMNLVCFAIVDDTDVVHSTFDPSITSAELFDEAQATLLTWESLLSASGGALKPSKSTGSTWIIPVSEVSGSPSAFKMPW